MNVEELTRNLIRIPSVTGNEKDVAAYIEELCAFHGWSCEHEYVAADRWNLYVNWTGVPAVVFSSHLDTVPGEVPDRNDDAYIFGRGACDTKGIIASMLCAGFELKNGGETPAFLFVVGEETGSPGAKTAALSGRKASFLINGEPTDNVLASGHKGTLSYTLTTSGRAAHSAYPEKGFSAIHVLLDIIGDIRAFDWGGNALFGEATTNIGIISGGVAPNVFADEATATIVHRIVDSTAQRKNDVLRLARDRSGVVFHSESGPQQLHVLPGFPAKAVSFGTDIPYLRALGTPLLIGPGSIHDAHTENEKIEIRQLHEAVKIYKQLFHTLKNA
jgi:acetylornithine deacetylase